MRNRGTKKSMHFLVMEIYDKPLNLAHQQARRADYFLQAEQYEDAIRCHKQAADYLQIAMKDTHSGLAKESLSLQYKNHLRQKDIVLLKQQQAQYSRNVESGSVIEETDAPTVNETSEDGSNTLVHRTINECDSLLRFLLSRNKNNRESEAVLESQTPNAVKVPKGDRLIIEELRVYNDSLREHILNLLKELEDKDSDLRMCRTDNGQLRETLRKYGDKTSNINTLDLEETFFSLNPNLNLDVLPAFELPPLEMPTFDINLLKKKVESHSNSTENQV